MNSNGDFYSGKYNADEIRRIVEVNARPTFLMKPFRAYYNKSATEHAPTWRDKREVWYKISDHNYKHIKSILCKHVNISPNNKSIHTHTLYL